MSRKRVPTRPSILLLQFSLILAALLALMPMLWMICAAFKSPVDIAQSTFLPWRHLDRLTVNNFEDLAAHQPIAQWMVNSLFLAATQTLLMVPLSSMAGFALAKYRFAGRNLVLVLLTATLLLPPQVLLTSLYELIRHLGWVDSYLALLVPAAVSAVGVILFRQAMLQVPDELLASARIDGCSELRLWWEIALPITRPMIGAFALMSFVGTWNSYLWPQIVLQDQRKYTMAIGLANLMGIEQYQTQAGLIMAGTLLGILPLMILFFAMQRELISGLTVGAVKE